jgi:hypothetical protein
VPVLAALLVFWTVEGTHLKVVDVAAEIEDVIAGAEISAGLEEPTRCILAMLLMNVMIFSLVRTPRSVERLRALGPGGPSSPMAAMVRVLLALQDAGGLGQVGVLERLCEDPDPAVARTALQWTSQARENAGDLAGAETTARRALDLCRPDDVDGPWSRALLTGHLASVALQRGDPARARLHAEVAVPLLAELGVVDDLVQLRCLLALVDIGDGRFEDAERSLAEVAALDPAHSVFGGAMFMLTGAAELALARGDIASGLRLYGEAVAGLHDMPGQDLATALAPWLLYPQAASLSAHVHVGRRDDAHQLHDELLVGVEGLLASPEGCDFPITGAVLFACALWDLGNDDAPARWPDAVRLLAVADGFAYNRMLPALAWEPTARLAERRCPGRLAAHLAEFAGRAPVDLRDDALAVLPGIGRV